MQFRLGLRLLGLMASVISVVRLGLLLMRGCAAMGSAVKDCVPAVTSLAWLQFSPECTAALQQWRNPAIFSQGVSPGDGGVKGCYDNGRVHDRLGSDISWGRAVNGIWSAELAQAHINYLESGLKTFSPSSGRAACVGEIRQLHGGGIREPSGGHCALHGFTSWHGK